MQIQKIISMYNNGYLASLVHEIGSSLMMSGTFRDFNEVRLVLATKIEQKYNVTLTLNDDADIITVTYND